MSGLTVGENIIKVQAWNASGNMGEAQVAINYNPQKEVAGTNDAY